MFLGLGQLCMPEGRRVRKGILTEDVGLVLQVSDPGWVPRV